MTTPRTIPIGTFWGGKQKMPQGTFHIDTDDTANEQINAKSQIAIEPNNQVGQGSANHPPFVLGHLGNLHFHHMHGMHDGSEMMYGHPRGGHHKFLRRFTHYF
jgi:hypothetical protein